MSPEAVLSNPFFLFFGPALLGICFACARWASKYVEGNTIFDIGAAVCGVGGGIAAIAGCIVYVTREPITRSQEGYAFGAYLVLGLVIMAVAYGTAEFIIFLVDKENNVPYTLRSKKGPASVSTSSFGIPSADADESTLISFAVEKADELYDILPSSGGVWKNTHRIISGIVDKQLPELVELRDRLHEDVSSANMLVAQVTASEGNGSEDLHIDRSAKQRAALIRMLRDVEGRITTCLAFLAHADLDIRLAVRRGEVAAPGLESQLSALSEEIELNATIEEQVQIELDKQFGSAAQ